MGTKQLQERPRIKRKSNLMRQRNRNLWLLAILPIIQVFIFCYLPMFGIVVAFKNYKYNLGILGSPWVGFDNFKFFLTSSDFARVAKNTILLNFSFIIAEMVAALAVAILLYELKSRLATKIYQTTMITPNFLSMVVVGYMAYAFLNPQLGLINRVLKLFGSDAVNWYNEPEKWPVILTIVSTWKTVGMKSVFYYAGLMGIDESLFEAASIDGASKIQKVRYVILPCLRKLIITLLILSIGNIFRSDFGLFYYVTRDSGSLYPTTDVMDTYIFRALRVVGDMSMSSAAGVLQSVVGLVTVLVTNAIVKKIDSEQAMF